MDKNEIISVRASSLSNIKSVRVYTKQLMTRYRTGYIDKQQFDTEIEGLKLIKECLVKDNLNKIKHLEKLVEDLTQQLKGTSNG